MRIRKLRIFTFFFVILVLCAVYGLALLRTYTFKAPPGASSITPGAHYAVHLPVDQVDPTEK